PYFSGQPQRRPCPSSGSKDATEYLTVNRFHGNQGDNALDLSVRECCKKSMSVHIYRILGVMGASLAVCGAAVSYSTPGATLTENFNTPAGTADNFVNNSTFLGWHAVSRTGTALPEGSGG